MSGKRKELEDEVHRSLKHWFGAGLTGCEFARTSLKKTVTTVFFEVFDAGVVDLMTTALMLASKRVELAVFAFPEISNEESLADALRQMRKRADVWDFTVARDEDGVVVDVLWKREPKAVSLVGFAPFADMPITRRSPFVTIAAWCGGYDNQFRTKRLPHVGVGDMKHSYDEKHYKALATTTNETMKNLRALPGGHLVKKGTTFRLPFRLEPAL